MASSKLFESWTFSLPIPEPFLQTIIDKGWNKASSEEEYTSIYNLMQQGKLSTLHGPVLRAVITLVKLMETDLDGALGMQKNDTGEIQFYCGEFKKETRRRELLSYTISRMENLRSARVETVYTSICRPCGRDRVMESIYYACLNMPA